jgi:hypothetical protein
MEYIIDILTDLEIVKVSVSGKLGEDKRNELISNAVGILNKSGYQKLLIDAIGLKVPKTNTVRTIHEFDMAENVKKVKMKSTIQVAIVNKYREDEDRKDFVKLAQFMGMVHMRHFKIYDKAITWLMGGKDIIT